MSVHTNENNSAAAERPTVELRAGTSLETHAIVLGSVTLKESDKLFTLLTLDHGKISALGKGAAKSVKRFGASLETLNHVKASLKVPCQTPAGESMWFLEKAELKSQFLHFRSDYSAMETGFFALRLVQDMIPEGMIDAALFRALGRFLRDSKDLNFSQQAPWVRLSFWTWFCHHLGFGDLSEPVEALFEQSSPGWGKVWHLCLAQVEPKFQELFHALGSRPLPTLELHVEIMVYKRWVEITGMHWEHFEKWVSSKKF